MRVIIYFFILELFFGLNGKWLVLGGISIRHWLFAVVLCLTCGKALYHLIQRYRASKKEQVTLGSFLLNELRQFRKFDWVFLLFLVSQLFWIVILPYIDNKLIPGALISAMKDGACIAITLLYFPTVYLLRIGKVDWKKYRGFVIGCCIASGVWHLLIYIAEVIQWQTDHSVYFMERVLNAWSVFVGGRCEPNLVIMPVYSVRILYTCSIFMLFAFYFILGKSKKKYWLWSLLSLLAIYTTGTRALLVALMAGLIVYFVADGVIWRYSAKQWKELFLRGIFVVLIAILADVALFEGRSVTRLMSSFSFTQEVLEEGQPRVLEWTSSEYSTESEIRGTTNSNSTRILEIKYYVGKFLEKPILGHGFSLQSDMDRDMQGLVYLTKVGIVGMLFCLGFFLCFAKRVLRMEKAQKGSGLPALYLVVAILTDIQFQTMFCSLTVAMAVFMFLDLEEKELQIEGK